MLRASGETVIVDDVHTIACTKCWCAEAKAIISAINTRCTSLQTRVKSAKFSAGKYNWRNLLLVGVACFATVKLTCGWLFGNRNGPGLREKIANLLESGNNFYELHLLTPMKHICTELLQGAVRPCSLDCVSDVFQIELVSDLFHNQSESAAVK